MRTLSRLLRWLSRASLGSSHAPSCGFSLLSIGLKRRSPGRVPSTGVVRSTSKSSKCMKHSETILAHSHASYLQSRSSFTLMKVSTTSKMSQVFKRLQVQESCEESLEDSTKGILNSITIIALLRGHHPRDFILTLSSSITQITIISTYSIPNTNSSIIMRILGSSLIAKVIASVNINPWTRVFRCLFSHILNRFSPVNQPEDLMLLSQITPNSIRVSLRSSSQ